MALPKCFKNAAKRKSTTIIPMVLLFIISIILLVLSVQQSSATIPDYTTEDGERPFSTFEEEVCDNVLYGFLSPFLFNFKSTIDCDENSVWYIFCQPAEGTTDYGLIGCPWRERNTVMRYCIVSIIIVATIIIFVIIITEKGTDVWSIIYWIHWILMLLMFVIFILDCDGLYSGYNSCLNEFDLDGDDSDSDTSYDSTSLINISGSSSSGIASVDTTIDCKLDPYIYTCLADLAAVIFGFCVWRISMFYKFDGKLELDKPSIQGVFYKSSIQSVKTTSPSNTTEMGALSTNQSSTGSVVSGNVISPPTGSSTMTATPNPPPTIIINTAGQTNKKEDSPDPFEELNAFNNNNSGGQTANNQGTTDDIPEDYVNPFDD